MFGEINNNHGDILAFEGEFYNAAELRGELGLRSDCEHCGILRAAYIKWGEACLAKLDGVFAFAVRVGSINNNLFCGRDRLGLKSFFYAVDISSGKFIFASDIKLILEKITGELDEQSVRELILIGPGRTPGCAIFKNISELEPGHCGVFSGGELKKYKYWDLREFAHGDNFNQTVERVRELVLDAITRRLYSDNKQVCTLLSGGLDSSIITSVAARYFGERGLVSFSVDYADNSKYFNASAFQPERDDKYIECMKDYINITHHQVILDTRELADALYDAVDARGLPGMADIDASLLLFCRHIKKYFPVALSGEGADEIFGGYPWFRDKQIRDSYGFPWSREINFRKSLFGGEFAYLSDTAESYVNERYEHALADVSRDNNKEEARIKELFNLNLKWFAQTLLERQDKMSGDLNIRAPFCDYKLVQYLYNIPWEYKNHNNIEKGLLREAFRDMLPPEIYGRKKSPYPKTYNPAYLSCVSKILAGIINNPSSPLLKIADKHALANLIALAPDIKFYGQLMNAPQIIAYFVQINYWLERYNIRLV